MVVDSEFDTNQSISLGEMRVEFVIDGRQVSAQARAVEKLFPSPKVVFEVSGVPREPEGSVEAHPGPHSISMLRSPLTSDGPEKLRLENGFEVEVVPSSWLFSQQEATIHLAHSPSVIFRSGDPIARLQFKVLNFSNPILNWPIAMEIAPWRVRIEPMSNLIQLERALRSNSGYSVTHTGVVEREDGRAFSQEEAQAFLDGLDNFLSFICSSSCAVTDVTGIGTHGSEVWKRWGSCHVDAWARRRTWADVTVRESLPAIFRNFWQDYIKNKRDLERALGWYIYSNQSEALDVSIIFNHAVLELLTYLTAGRKPDRMKTGDWIAENLRKEGIDPQIPTLCSELTAFAKVKGLRHGPHTLVNIRNSMVHPNPTIHLPSVDAYYEAKRLGLWYGELMLLKRFQYTGEYASQLTPLQTPGRTEHVPWARNNTN